MNLFFNPSATEFQQLISNAKSNKEVHDVVVDYDGEVLVDPQLEKPELLDKFKVHLHLSEASKKAIDNKPSRLRNLFNRILNAWNKSGLRPTALSY